MSAFIGVPQQQLCFPPFLQVHLGNEGSVKHVFVTVAVSSTIHGRGKNCSKGAPAAWTALFHLGFHGPFHFIRFSPSCHLLTQSGIWRVCVVVLDPRPLSWLSGPADPSSHSLPALAPLGHGFCVFLYLSFCFRAVLQETAHNLV